VKDSNKKIQEMQILEQNLQNLLLQKQAFQMELNETLAALKEIDDSSDEVYKIVGQLLIKTDKPKMKEDLTNKERLLNLRIKTLEKQEEAFSKKLKEDREELMKSMKR